MITDCKALGGPVHTDACVCCVERPLCLPHLDTLAEQAHDAIVKYCKALSEYKDNGGVIDR